MNSSSEKHNLHLVWLIAYSFIGSAVFWVGSNFFIPDTSIDPPIVSPIMIILSRIQTVLVIVGCTAYGIKLTEEKQIIPSIGFTLMAIAQGVLYIIFTISFNSHEKIAEAYRMFSSGVYLMIPAVLMIAYCNDFARWLRISGIVFVGLMCIEYISFLFVGSLTFPIIIIDTIANGIMNIVVIGWGIALLKSEKKRKALAN
jgi:hypothetical protein